MDRSRGEHTPESGICQLNPWGIFLALVDGSPRVSAMVLVIQTYRIRFVKIAVGCCICILLLALGNGFPFRTQRSWRCIRGCRRGRGQDGEQSIRPDCPEPRAPDDPTRESQQRCRRQAHSARVPRRMTRPPTSARGQRVRK